MVTVATLAINPQGQRMRNSGGSGKVWKQKSTICLMEKLTGDSEQMHAPLHHEADGEGEKIGPKAGLGGT